jgi:hypothetical protein
MHHRYRFLSAGVLTLAIATLGLTSCEKKESGPTNEAPVIASVSASTTTTTKNQQVTLIAVAEDPDGDGLNFQWSAPSGSFNTTDNDTVIWTAPEAEGIISIALRVDDDVNITTGSIDIGVGVYVPAVQPYYVGAAQCSGCHSATHTAWLTTAHSDAFDRKHEDFSSDYCLQCHTVGYDPSIDNGGYDENPITALQNIQCESCHGPASAHLASTDKANDPRISATLSETVCESCHTSSRTSFWTDWAASGHASGEVMGLDGENSSSCSGCHVGNGFVDKASGNATKTYDPEVDGDVVALTCATCHDPHSGANLHQVRDVTATTANGIAITRGGLGLLCMNCHTGRRTNSQVTSALAGGSTHFGPHHGNQGAFLVPGVYADPSGGTFTFSSSNHLDVEDSCVTCHMHGEGIQPPATNGFSSHKYEPSVEACESCHGILTDFDDIIAKQDYDGDGSIEGVQSEVSGLMTLLEGALYATGLDTTGTDNSIVTAAGYSTDSTATWAGVNLTTYPLLKIRAAAWNLAAVTYDGSHGVHNAIFTIQLLQQSYKALVGSDVPSAHMLDEDAGIAIRP